MSGSNILLILSGSIACSKACAAVSRLVQAGHNVRIVATSAALRFVGGAAPDFIVPNDLADRAEIAVALERLLALSVLPA